MKIQFLGTGSGVPSKERNVSAIALDLLQEQGNVWLFDCGEATQHQILKTNIRPRKIEKIFITHLHGDHIYGLPGLLSSRSFQGGETPLTIIGPKGIKDYIQISLEVNGAMPSYPILYQEVFEGLVDESDHFEVYAIKLEHGIESFGYRVIEKNRPGQLQVEKLKQAGIPPGPIYQKIKENEQVKLADGQLIFRSDYIGPDKEGRVISILGDTRYIPRITEFIKGSDILVHEATFSANEQELAYNYFHSTTQQAAALAADGQVQQLILTHISSRYQHNDVVQLLQEAQELFPNTIIAHDFFELEIPAKS